MFYIISNLSPIFFKTLIKTIHVIVPPGDRWRWQTQCFSGNLFGIAGHSNHSFKYVSNFRNATCPFLNRFPFFFQEFRFLRAKTIIFVYFVNPVRKIRVSEVLLEATHTQNDHRGLNRSPGPQLVFFTFLSVTDNHTNSIEPLKR